jgi:organic radical activating enzyme
VLEVKRYKVKELFLTVQGEGHWSGTPAILLRLSGCNLWSGLDEQRERDSKRNNAICPLFCDTDFVGGAKLTAEDIVERIESALEGSPFPPLCFVTGGEPLLQVDQDLHDTLCELFEVVAFETNGTRDLPFVPTSQTWITVSPKTPVDSMGSSFFNCSELKVVFPEYNPLPYEKRLNEKGANPALWVQPCDGTYGSTGAALHFIYENPKWRLSVQTHKIIGVR